MSTAEPQPGMKGIFDPIADSYDRWYDTPEGRAVFEAEVRCLRSLSHRIRGRWLEVGAGTGRFASALGIARGLDPSIRMLKIAARRGLEVILGRAESLPVRPDSLDGILMALALCFVADARTALAECRRVLRPGGRLLLGTVPADGPWGREYVDKAARGHPVYASARFRTAAEEVDLVKKAGFVVTGAAATLFWRPGELPPAEARVEPGIVPEAGFLAMMCVCET